MPSAPTSGVNSAAVSGKPTASDSLALSASLPTSSRTGGSMEDPGNSTAATCASPVPQDDASTPGSTVSPDTEKYERRQEELVLKLKVSTSGECVFCCLCILHCLCYYAFSF
jgi:hypothetical protein